MKIGPRFRKNVSSSDKELFRKEDRSIRTIASRMRISCVPASLKLRFSRNFHAGSIDQLRNPRGNGMSVARSLINRIPGRRAIDTRQGGNAGMIGALTAKRSDESPCHPET
jgi:hypothetical protein